MSAPAPVSCKMLPSDVMRKRLGALGRKLDSLYYRDGTSATVDYARVDRLRLRLRERLDSLVTPHGDYCEMCATCGRCYTCAQCPDIGGYHQGPPGGAWRPCEHNAPFRLGLEVEVELSAAQARREPRALSALCHALAHALPGRCLLERDGSLREGRSVETISQPHCFACALNYAHKLGLVLRGDAVATHRCGVHVHLGGISRSERKRLRQLCSTRNAAFCKRLFGRLSPRFARLHETSGDDGDGDRYVAVNYSPRTGTTEFRLFRGTTSAGTLCRYVETAHALATWAREGPPVPYVRDGFVAFVSEHQKSYPRLATHLSKIGGAPSCA